MDGATLSIAGAALGGSVDCANAAPANANESAAANTKRFMKASVYAALRFFIAAAKRSKR
jgi:hypothetical protein